MELNLKGRVAVVTGAGRGIGLAITRALADEAAYVVAGSLSTGNLQGLDGVTPVAVDLTTPEGPASLVERAITDHGQIDILVNNVGALKVRLGGFFGTTDEDFQWAMQMNFFIALCATRAAAAHMVERGSGSIVNIASVNAFYHPDTAVVDYGAAKAALLNLTKALSQEFGPLGVRINAISPGPVETDLWLGDHGVASTVAEASGVDRETARKSIVAAMGGIPTGRFTTPDQVATLAVMLSSDRTANVTGANFIIDGGLIKTT